MKREDYIEIDIDKLLKEAKEKVDTVGVSEDTSVFRMPPEEEPVSETIKLPVDEKKQPPVKNNNIVTRLKKHVMCAVIIICFLVLSYLTIVYSQIPFIAKWRTIYIETAMTTNSHQWLATLFFPQSVIDEVMAKYKKNAKKQKKVKSEWNIEDIEEEPNLFFDKYWELDSLSFHDYLKKLSKSGNEKDNLFIDNFDEKENIKTVNGDTLLVLDTKNNLMIIKIKGEGYQGKLAIVKDPEQVQLAKSNALGSFGQEAGSFGQTNDALLVVNASGFVDVEGKGFGGDIKGSLIIDGVDYGHPYRQDWKFCGVKYDNRMYITNYSPDIVKDYRWAVEFYPALMVDGESVVDGTYGMGIQPRTTVGQTKNGDFLLLVVDGRQPGYSLGCTVEDCLNVMKGYKVYQAMNMDGGSSSVMWYNGNYITKSSSVTGLGRYMPDAIIVKKVDE